jgi:threonine dehydratase
MADTMAVTFEHIEQAAARIAGYVHRTPVLGSELLDRAAGCEIRFKCENLQKTGAFKARGAHNAVLSLSSGQRRGGVATHSSGNHAAALALAASRIGVPAHIVMPDNAPAVKVDAVRAYGGRITFCEATLAAREEALRDLCDRTEAYFIPPYDHPDVIAGQGTVALEIAEQSDTPPDHLVIPVGGGGLLAGCAIAGRALLPDTQIIGAEPAGADDALRSFRSGIWQPQLAPDTVADGLRTSLGKLNFAIIRREVDDILCAEDAAIIESMRLVWTRMKMVIEPSAAVGLAVVLAHPGRFVGKRVAIVLSGGNVDLDHLPW